MYIWALLYLLIKRIDFIVYCNEVRVLRDWVLEIVYACVFTDSGEEEGLEEFELRDWFESPFTFLLAERVQLKWLIVTNFIYTIVYLTFMKTTVLVVHGHLLVVNHHHCENMVIWYCLVFEIWVCFTHWQAISKEKGSTLYIHV